MDAPKGGGIADDAEAYADLDPAAPAREAGPRPRPPAEAKGIASDASDFEALVAEGADDGRSLETGWLYQVNGQVFGPVKPRALLEMLYAGDLAAETPVSTEDGEFMPLRRYGVFRAHLPRVEKHQAELEAARAREALEARARLKRHLGWAAAALVALLVGSAGLVAYVQSSRAKAALAEKAAKEEALRRQLDELLASVSIEPPLMPLAEDPAAPAAQEAGRGKRAEAGRAVARFSGGVSRVVGSGTQELSRVEIMEGVGRAFGGFKRCIVAQIQREPESVPEELVVTFAIGNDGRAREVSLTDRHLRRSPLNDCLATQLGQVAWRAYKGEVQNVEYPITIGRPR
jgi:hypothetical protein